MNIKNKLIAAASAYDRRRANKPGSKHVKEEKQSGWSYQPAAR
jgi:hypothetical protein